jgi:two-component system, LytTR family, sensor kinase
MTIASDQRDADFPSLSANSEDRSAGASRWLALAPATWQMLGVATAAWTAIGLVILTERYFYNLSAGTPQPDLGRAWMTMASMWIWAAMTPAILWLAERYSFEQRRWHRYLAIHAGFSLAFAFVGAMLEASVAPWLDPKPTWTRSMWFFSQVFIDMFSYFAILAVGQAKRYHALYAERRLRAVHLEAELLRTKLQALEMQLRPHFLFNTLHTISALVRMDHRKEAVRMLAGLGELLRSVLRSEGQEVTLRRELEFIERYLEIEQVRFQSQLETRVEIEPGLLDALVPHLVLQPLVENALRHGLQTDTSGLVEIRVRRELGMLVLSVRDSGEGPSEGRSAPKDGIGLGNTRARLSHLYGERQRLELTRGENGGGLVEVAIPYHTEAWGPPAGAVHSPLVMGAPGLTDG